MKKYLLLLILSSMLGQEVEARKTFGYFVRINNDTVQANFRLRKSLQGELNLKSIRVSMWYKEKGQKSSHILPEDIKLVMVTDTSFGLFEIHSLKIGTEYIFAECMVNGRLSAYRSERENWAQLINKYESSTIVTYHVQLMGKPLSVPIDKKFWISYLGKEYAEFTECLGWDKKKTREMRKNGTPCFWEEKQLVDIARLFNKKYP